MNGVTSIALAITFSSGVAITMKVANAKNLKLGQFLAVNYLVCSLGLLGWGAWRTLGFNSPFIWSLGILVGIMYVLCLWLFNRAIASGGLALSTTLMRLSAAIPTMGSLILFAEQTNLYQILGIVLAFMCLPLASKAPLRFDQAGKEALKGMTWGLLLFAAYGMTDFAFKVQAELEPSADPNAFMATIFGTALLFTFPQLFKGIKPNRECLFWGFVLGLTNVLATYFWILTLAHMPGAVAFPTLGLGVIAVTTLASLLIWRERLRPANFTFLVLASVAVFLINLG
ncbi:MAG: EamA family transporter [Deltaproteobacteria bacterium]|nr:EamA family transporter [Deltaproteobacteria bacterium]